MNMSTPVTACIFSSTISHHQITESVRSVPLSPPSDVPSLSRYESQKRCDWTSFGNYLKNHWPPLVLSRCSGAHVLEFLKCLDQFRKTKIHVRNCMFFCHLHPPAPCPCPCPRMRFVDHLRAVLCIKFDLQLVGCNITVHVLLRFDMSNFLLCALTYQIFGFS
ncbi:hypothetical protein J1N35_039557 [Gossypium stocksii]|uniref:ALOG domain-containing protein n=1 Tax=Gossypium stocksii TaxID=47602 RepID=A0A9D3UP76_9ROSI|nr:hypothetical protein J1N35_039557 [Gossypium stocksii]